ncbi:GNAT family N-acetyltransferase [Dysgonomonas sp. Marseille-P4677]|uniref:GNAT family N-acetyltransferase n=1 Tax=Dysgonomonas sp. Marseille-P4677 TaxID=2364790 RepID=UPI001911E6E9|nr:GNAT family N-acetyltransferase [Dysgonomonas sp. Marseille-P4677]MBK5722024.1 GNAT family N-acetyltransferase [Dysgonomonas sp. Marseille-P4677]
MISLIRTHSNNADFFQLIEELDSFLNMRNGDLQAQYDAYNLIEKLATVVIVYHSNRAIGCGCFKEYDKNRAELKRMYVNEQFRGTGTASRLLDELEKWATEKNYKGMILETGVHQLEAIRFYQKNGYVIIENFDQYAGNENSICMSKPL